MKLSMLCLLTYMILMFALALRIIGENNLPIRTFTWWDVVNVMMFMTAPAILGFYAGRDYPKER